MDQAIVIVPGIGNSGPDHWQSHWETAFPRTARIAPASWEAPDLADWTAALDAAVANAGAPPLVICHSLGCLLFAHWHARSARAVRGAFLVAVPDPAGPRFPVAAAAFANVPGGRFGRVPVLAIASADDPYDPAGRALEWATEHGATPLLLGARGHLNAASGLGGWPEGRALLAAFAAGLGR
ncbi:TPA: serine hydrolase family protein [Burkholderia cenocepacia]|uniref:RBBP9/YdeN family alpha/beta hydrolase n=1 Tax=Burkholderia cenocepacia TaxID=95486 RepID=UPI001B950304|nr:alpha/beta hydrolase [Burkholderia cenocepacia]MBR8198790.1 serine hydrolase family protein [Burkholderia cenocepacia]HDV6327240.1 serine hydrolase family protein [Burkholderia cenocepacia]HDV6352629.1 serine hydrolase family protein [Burkholderia cenocepacia]